MYSVIVVTVIALALTAVVIAYRYINRPRKEVEHHLSILPDSEMNFVTRNTKGSLQLKRHFKTFEADDAANDCAFTRFTANIQPDHHDDDAIEYRPVAVKK